MARKKSSITSTLFSETTVAISIMIGVIIVWIASIVGTFGEGTSAAKAMTVLRDTGITLISAMLIGGGITGVGKEKIVRGVMIFMGTIILLVLVYSVQIWSPLSLLM